MHVYNTPFSQAYRCTTLRNYLQIGVRAIGNGLSHKHPYFPYVYADTEKKINTTLKIWAIAEILPILKKVFVTGNKCIHIAATAAFSRSCKALIQLLQFHQLKGITIPLIMAAHAASHVYGWDITRRQYKGASESLDKWEKSFICRHTPWSIQPFHCLFRSTNSIVVNHYEWHINGCNQPYIGLQLTTGFFINRNAHAEIWIWFVFHTKYNRMTYIVG